MAMNSLKVRAAAAGMTVLDYAKQHLKDENAIGKMARMYFIQQGKTHGDGQSTPDVAGDKRTPGQKLYQLG